MAYRNQKQHGCWNRATETEPDKHRTPRPLDITTVARVGIGEWKAFPVGADGQGSQQTPMTAGEFLPAVLEALKAQADAMTSLVEALKPEAPDFVGTDYIARRMGCSPQWVGKMADKGDIPKECIAPKLSGGRIWRFHRRQTDAWLQRKGGA